MDLLNLIKNKISPSELIIIVALTLIFHYILISIPLFAFSYGEFWVISISLGGILIPIIASIYLIIRSRIKLLKIVIGVVLITFITFFVSYSDPDVGIILYFPFWIIPIILTFIVSFKLNRKENQNIASLGFISGSLGMIFGINLLHLPMLLMTQLSSPREVMIGGGLHSYNMFLILGIVTIVFEIIIMLKEKAK